MGDIYFQTKKLGLECLAVYTVIVIYHMNVCHVVQREPFAAPTKSSSTQGYQATSKILCLMSDIK